MHLRALRMVFVAVLLAGASLTATAVPAQADAAQCDNVIIDATAAGVLGDTASITAAATRLEALGADVRVRAFESVNDTNVGGSLDAYRDNSVAVCPSWRGADGKLKANLVLYMMSMDRKSAIFYGSNWRDELDDQVDYIRGTVMGDQFRNGDFAAGFADAIDATYQAINQQQNPAPQEPGVSFGDTTFGKVLVWLLVGLAVVFLIGFIIFGARSAARQRREKREAEAAAQKRAQKARNEAIDALSLLSTHDTIDTDVELILADLNPEDTEVISRVHGFYTDSSNKAYSLHGQMSDLGDEYDPDKPHTVNEYDAIMRQYYELKSEAEKAAKNATTIDEHIADLRREMAAAPERINELKQRVASNMAKHEQDEAAGYKPISYDKLNLARKLIEAAEKNIADKRLGVAIGNLENASEALDDDAKLLEDSQQLRANVNTKLQSLQANERRAQEVIDMAPAVFDTLRSKYDVRCVDYVLGTFSDLKAALPSASAFVRKVEQHCSLDEQNWALADRTANEAADLFKPIMLAANSVASSDANYSKQLAAVPKQVNSLRREAQSAIDEIGGFKGEHGTALAKLRDIDAALERISAKARLPKPDLMEIDSQLSLQQSTIATLRSKAFETDRKIRKREEDKRREAERRRREREEQEAAERRRRRQQSSSDSFTGGAIGGYIGGSSSHHDSGGYSGGGGYDSGGSSGGWGGGDSGGSSGGW